VDGILFSSLPLVTIDTDNLGGEREREREREREGGWERKRGRERERERERESSPSSRRAQSLRLSPTRDGFR